MRTEKWWREGSLPPEEGKWAKLGKKIGPEVYRDFKHLGDRHHRLKTFLWVCLSAFTGPGSNSKWLFSFFLAVAGLERMDLLSFVSLYSRLSHEIYSIINHRALEYEILGHFIFFFLSLFYLFWERENEQGRGRERGRERIPSRHRAVNAESDAGLKPTNREITAWDEIKTWMLNWLSHPGAP